MKPSHFVLMCLLFALLFNKTWGQNCLEDPIKKAGDWKKKSYSVPHAPTTNPVTLKNLPAILSTIDSIGALFIKYNPHPVGSEVRWYASVGTLADSLTCPDPAFADYMYNAGFFPYYCSGTIPKTESETKTWIYLSINSYWSSGSTAQHQLNALPGIQWFTLPPQRGSLGGYPVFEPIPIGEVDEPRVLFYSVLIHHPGTFPYLPVTKGEFFEANRLLIERTEKEDLDGLGYQRRNMGEEWYKEQTERVRDLYLMMRKKLTQLIQIYQKELQQPAILRTWEWTIRSLEIANPDQKNLFTTANRGYQLVKANQNYMDQSQAKWKPQFMWVQWSKDLASRNSFELDKIMHEKFDFNALGNLLAQ